MATREIVINEVPCYLFNKFDKATCKLLKIVPSSFYDADELDWAKTELHTASSKLLNDDMPRVIKRKGDNRGKLIVDDFVDIFTMIDERIQQTLDRKSVV